MKGQTQVHRKLNPILWNRNKEENHFEVKLRWGRYFLTISHLYSGKRKAVCTTGNKCLSVSLLFLSQMEDDTLSEAMITNAY